MSFFDKPQHSCINTVVLFSYTRSLERQAEESQRYQAGKSHSQSWTEGMWGCEQTERRRDGQNCDFTFWELEKLLCFSVRLLIIMARESCVFENFRKTYSHLFMLLRKSRHYQNEALSSPPSSICVSSRPVPFISVIWSVSSARPHVSLPLLPLSALVTRLSALLQRL